MRLGASFNLLTRMRQPLSTFSSITYVAILHITINQQNNTNKKAGR